MVAAASMSTLALEARGVSVRFGQESVLVDAGLSLPKGSAYALLGRSGVGKSTLLRALVGLEHACSGEAWIDGVHYLSKGELVVPGWKLRRSIGLVFQSLSLFPNLTALENLTLGPRRNLETPRAEAVSRAREVARSLAIEHVLDKYPSQISGGQAQRVALGRALLLQPRVLLLDEVTSALDPETVKMMLDALWRVRELAPALSMLVVTHQLAFAELFADRILFLHEGRMSVETEAANFRACTDASVVDYLRCVL